MFRFLCFYFVLGWFCVGCLASIFSFGSPLWNYISKTTKQNKSKIKWMNKWTKKQWKKNAKWLEKLAFSMAIKSMEIVFEYFANAQNAIACFSIKNSKKNGRFCLVKPNVCTFMSLMIKYSNRLRWIHIFHDKTRTKTHSKWICLQFHRICRFLKLYDESCIFLC